MKSRYDPTKHHRRSIRLKGYDYASPGSYFVTIVTSNRELLFDNEIYRRVPTPIGALFSVISKP